MIIQLYLHYVIIVVVNIYGNRVLIIIHSFVYHQYHHHHRQKNFFNLQRNSLKRTISLEIIDKFLINEYKLTEIWEVDQIFELLQNLILAQDDPTTKSLGLSGGHKKKNNSALFGSESANLADNDSIDSTQTILQQENLAKFIHLIYNNL